MRSTRIFVYPVLVGGIVLFSVPMSFAAPSGFASFFAQMREPGNRVGGVRPWLVSAAIVYVGLVLYGGGDLIRTRWVRIRAISGVCQTEALRKGVLWVTPLAILGVVVVSQFQHPMDAQDSIRQITKFCLFTSGMLVTIVAVILAATNLPREIENRVIYTIVTKPTTRLEIVLGKVVGFARVSGLIILIMGLFTLLYLELRTRPMIEDLKTQLASLEPNSPLLATDKYYVNSGLLGTRSLEWSDDVQFYSPPTQDPERWMAGGLAMYFLVPFDFSADEKMLLNAAVEKDVPVELRLVVDVDQHVPTQQQLEQADQMGLIEHPSRPREIFGPKLPATEPAVSNAPKKPDRMIPQIGVRFLDDHQRPLSGMNDSRDVGININLAGQPGRPYTGAARVDNQLLARMLEVGRFIAQVNGKTPSMEFGVKARPIAFTFAWPITAQGVFVPLTEVNKYPPGSLLVVPPIEITKDPLNPTRSASPLFFAYPARRGGMRLTAASTPTGGPVAVFGFHDIAVSPGRDGKIGLQVGAVIERLADFSDDKNHTAGYTSASVEIRNRTSGESSGPITFSPEISRTEPVSVDARYFIGGNFDVMLRNSTVNQSLGIEAGPGGAVAVITADRSFAFNLVKSLFILWLLSILVAIIAIFSSTFVSWPIAIVLTLIILLGHWGVDQLGDSLKPGGGRTVATGFGFRDPAATNVVTYGVDNLSAMLTRISKFLPDVSKFPVTEDIERGVSIPPSKVQDALGVLLCYGLPMIVFSYVILRRKEVAP